MSKDIRSFFKVLSTKNSDKPQPIQKQKKTVLIKDSDDDDFVPDTPQKHKRKTVASKRRPLVLNSDSDSDDGKSRKKKSPPKKQKIEEPPKLRPVNLETLNKPLQQSKVEYTPKAESSKTADKKSRKETKRKDHKKSKNKKNTEIGIHGDEDFEKTLEDLDEDSDDTILLDNLDILDKTIEAAEKFTDKDGQILETGETSERKHEESKGPKEKKIKDDGKEKKHLDEKESEVNNDKRKKENGHSKEKKHEIIRKDEKVDTKDRKLEKEQNQELEKTTWENKVKGKANERNETPKKAEKRQRKNSESTPTPKKRQKLEHTDSGIDPDQEKWERKMHSASLYQAYLNRPLPKNQGQKIYPKGKQDCLRGITFLKTGVLDSLDGDEFRSLVSDHGGKFVHTISKKVNYVVVGDEPGPAKIEKARKYKIPELNEDQFLDIILVKSGMKPKYAVKNVSEDFGLGGSETGSEELMDIALVHEENSGKLEESHESINKQTTYIKVKEELDSEVDHKKLNIKEEFKHEVNKKQLSPKEDKTVKISSEIIKTEPIKKELGVAQQNLCWTEKYKPSSMKEVIGQQDQNSNMNKLKRWLENWFKNQEPEQRKKMPKPNPFRPCGGGEYYKAALLSGSPGVGKTTTATLVAKELGFDIVEFNASDTRNKKLLHEEISHMMNSKTVAGFATGEKNVNKKRVLLMDEVDGMAGNEDRGGIAELISFIKTASFPIICMCNNRDHQKMRTLVTHCFELRFGKPNVNQVRGAMLTICFKEGLKIKPDALARLITGTGCDIRQTLNHLTMWSAAEKNISSDVVQKESKNSQKDVVMGPWDVIRTVFTTSLNKDMSLSDKSRLFFYDYSLGPLFVQENYYYVTPDCTSGNADEEALIRRYLAADSLSKSDLIESKIRSTNNWSLLESQAFYSTVLPSYYMSGTMGKCNFPGWFGVNSRRNKKLRIVSELYSHARTRISGDKNAMHLDYAEPLRDLILRPLREKGPAGAEDTLDVMINYSLLRDDMLNLFDLLNRFDKPNFYEKIGTNVKVALTKLYNKKMVLNFAPPVAAKKKKRGKGEGDEELLGDEEEFSDEEETEENVTDDTLIKVKTKAKAGTSKASTSKQEPRGKGKTSKASEGKGSKGKGKK